MREEALIAATMEEEDRDEEGIRPETLAEFIGQAQLRESLSIAIAAAKKRGVPLDHLLFSGPPGLGKTTLAHIIAREMGAAIHCTSGPVLEKAGDLAAILTLVSEGELLFIDEIHRLPTV
ncbi:MAG TPA: AAA family ATPase, partial [Methanoregulaceae archaeon]|nr:AAA family ATPase [Methanoregulaceae archaeon]